MNSKNYAWKAVVLSGLSLGSYLILNRLLRKKESGSMHDKMPAEKEELENVYQVDYSSSSKHSRLTLSYGVPDYGNQTIIKFNPSFSFHYRTWWDSLRYWLFPQYQLYPLHQPGMKQYLYPLNRITLFPHDLGYLFTKHFGPTTPIQKICIKMPTLEELITVNYPLSPYEVFMEIMIELKRYLEADETPSLQVTLAFPDLNSFQKFIWFVRRRIKDAQDLQKLIGG